MKLITIDYDYVDNPDQYINLMDDGRPRADGSLAVRRELCIQHGDSLIVLHNEEIGQLYVALKPALGG